MPTKDTSNPAFPTNEGDTYDGMTLRDYFAAKAMQAIIQTPRAQEYVDDEGFTDEENTEAGVGFTFFPHSEFLAQEAYLIADGMLEARSK